MEASDSSEVLSGVSVFFAAGHDIYEFLNTHYRERFMRRALKANLQHADAEDLTNLLLRKIPLEIESGKFVNHSKESFEKWAAVVFRNALADFRKSRGFRDHLQTNSEQFEVAIEKLSSDESVMECATDLDDFLKTTFSDPVRRVRKDVSETEWTAFFRTAIRNIPAAEVADQLGISVSKVYTSKAKVLERLKQHFPSNDTGDLKEQKGDS
jgi:RNA polymerase sigma factor (sigma-70 family)